MYSNSTYMSLIGKFFPSTILINKVFRFAISPSPSVQTVMTPLWYYAQIVPPQKQLSNRILGFRAWQQYIKHTDKRRQYYICHVSYICLQLGGLYISTYLWPTRSLLERERLWVFDSRLRSSSLELYGKTTSNVIYAATYCAGWKLKKPKDSYVAKYTVVAVTLSWIQHPV